MECFERDEVNKILANSNIGIWRIEFDPGLPPRFYGDATMDYLLGVEGEITPEQRFEWQRDHIHPEDMQLFLEYAQKIADENVEITYRYMHPTLGMTYARCGGQRCPSPEGTFYCSGTHQNITDTFRMEREKIEEQRWAERFNIIQTFSKVYSSSYYVDLINDTFMELGNSNAAVSSMIGTSGGWSDRMSIFCEQVLCPEFRDEMTAFMDASTLDRRLKGRDWISKQYKNRFHGWVEGFLIVAKRDILGKCEHVIWATRNISEMKQKELFAQEELEKAKQRAEIANKAKTSFLFNMSHDIRTPMNAIIGFTDLLEENIDNPELCRDYIGKMKKSNEFLLSLINNVLEMARIESGKLVLDETIWNAEDFNGALYSLFEQSMNEKEIRFTSEMDVQHHYVFCDSLKLRQIFLNILSNACKYTPVGGEIRMVLKELPSKREGYALYETTVTDTGIGMSKEYLPTIFDEFSREQSVTDSKIEGTGLGMPIVKKLVELMDGTITVESELGKGSSFVVRVYHRIADETDLKVDDVEASYTNCFAKKRVLLAEDNDLNAEIAGAILENLGFEVHHAEDGIVCVDMVSKESPGYYDLILMDIQMPHLNGYEAAKRIRSFGDAKKANIPIIAITANAFEVDRKEALACGMNGHQSKPINVKELVAEINRVLRN